MLQSRAAHVIVRHFVLLVGVPVFFKVMFIGVCTIDVHIPSSGSLKGKRQSLRSLKDRIRNTFNVSVAEVDGHDLWQRASIAVAAVNNDKSHLNRTLDRVLNLVRTVPDVSLLDYHIELF